MNLCRDKQVKFFYLFLISFTILLSLSSAVLCSYYTKAAKEMLFSHDEALVTSLLEQGVPRDTIAAAIANEERSSDGAAFLLMIGRTADSVVRFTPFLSQFQQTAALSIFITLLALSLLLFGGSYLFLWKREQLYQESAAVIKCYLNGNYTYHLPQKEEGTLYQIFALIEQLATRLQAKNDAQHRTKEFLKNTISDISHQLKTPLAALSMYQEIMENEPEHPDVIREFSYKTGLALRRMEQLIQAMLKITRLDAGNIVFEKTACCIPDLLAHAIEELNTRAEKEDKNIILIPPATLSDDASETTKTLTCDWEWTSEAIANIVKNALDHTKAGDNIRISWEHSPFMTRIMITDTGSGIAPEDIHHIFKRFFRSKKSLDTNGAGLGLPLAKSIIEGQGGILSVQSSLGEGTTFTAAFL